MLTVAVRALNAAGEAYLPWAAWSNGLPEYHQLFSPQA